MHTVGLPLYRLWCKISVCAVISTMQDLWLIARLKKETLAGYLEAEQQGTLAEWMRQHNGGQSLDPAENTGGCSAEPASCTSELSGTFSQDLNRIADTRQNYSQEVQYAGDSSHSGLSPKDRRNAFAQIGNGHSSRMGGRLGRTQKGLAPVRAML